MFYLIGLGLNERSLGEEAREILKRCDKIYLETYTINFPYNIEKLKEEIKFEEADREKVESEEIVLEGKNKDVALLVYGSPLNATTHISLILRAEKEKIKYRVLHNASIIDAIAETGLQLYKFGKIASMSDWKEKGKSLSFVKIIKDNLKIRAHSLILVDIGLSLKSALNQLEKSLKEKRMNKILENKILVCCKLGTKEGKIMYGKIKRLEKKKLSLPICFIIPGKMHFLEEEALRRFDLG